LELWSITVGFGLLIVYNYIYQKLYRGPSHGRVLGRSRRYRCSVMTLFFITVYDDMVPRMIAGINHTMIIY
jgi:hypothetical protein